jgi:hypothetical protein
MSEQLDVIDVNEAIEKLTEWKIIDLEIIKKLSLSDFTLKYLFFLIERQEEVKGNLVNSDNLIDGSHITTEEQRYVKRAGANAGLMVTGSFIKKVFIENFNINPTECIHPPIVQRQRDQDNTCLMCGHTYGN